MASLPDPHPDSPPAPEPDPAPDSPPGQQPVEVGGRRGPEPTRFGDWEKNGIAVDF